MNLECYALRFGFWGTLGISTGRRVTVFGLPSNTECHRMNARLIIWQKKNNIRFSDLWRICVVADVPLDFPVVFTVSIIMIRLRYIIESCQSLQTVSFSGLKNISLQILRIVGRDWNGAVACYVKGYHHHRLLQGVWSDKLSPDGCWTSSVASVYQTMKPCNGQYYRHKAS